MCVCVRVEPMGNMLKLILAILATCSLTNGQEVINGQSISETEIQSLLNDYNSKAAPLCRAAQEASWNVATDVGNKDKETIKVR